MPATITTHKGLKVTTPTPTGVGGQALNDNFTTLADRLFVQTVLSAVISRSASNPPGVPAEGDLYIIGAAPTGAWAGSANDIAVRYNSAWEFVTPQVGYHAKVLDSGELVWFNGTAWVAYQFGNPRASERYQFRVNYVGSNPVAVDPAEPLPAGWSIAFAGALATITHTAAKYPTWASYLGRNGATTVLRYPTAVAQLSIVTGEELTKFTLSIGTATTGAASGSSALVTVQF